MVSTVSALDLAGLSKGHDDNDKVLWLKPYLLSIVFIYFKLTSWCKMVKRNLYVTSINFTGRLTRKWWRCRNSHTHNCTVLQLYIWMQISNFYFHQQYAVTNAMSTSSSLIEYCDKVKNTSTYWHPPYATFFFICFTIAVFPISFKKVIMHPIIRGGDLT